MALAASAAVTSLWQPNNRASVTSRTLQGHQAAFIADPDAILLLSGSNTNQSYSPLTLMQ